MRIARFIPAGVLFCAGCATYSITPGGNGVGYDIYRPEPYILVLESEGGADGDAKQTRKKWTAELVWLPDYSVRYRIDTFNFLAKADFEFHIEDGWKLTSIADKGDATAVPAAILEVLKTAAEAIPGSAAREAPEAPLYLYKVVYGPDGIVRGLKKLGLEPGEKHDPPRPPEFVRPEAAGSR